MIKKKESKQIKVLDRCLTLVQSGKASIADCLKAYPEQAAFLEPLLLTALQARSSLSPDRPDEAYIAATEIRIINQLQALKRKPHPVEAKSKQKRALLPRPALAILSLALVLMMLVSGIGVASASADALPGDALYSVKRGVEEVRLLLTIHPTKDAELLIAFTTERLQEIEDLVQSDPTQDLGSALQEYESMLSRLLETAQEENVWEDSETIELIHNGISHNQEVLQRVLEKAPASAHEGLENAIENSNHGKSVIQTIQEGGSPSDLAPGQQKKESENQGKPEDEDRGPKQKEKTKEPKPKEEKPNSNSN
jgi:hypothetical protein